MVTFPFIYLIFYLIFFYKFIGNTYNSFSLYGVLVLQWIRFVLLPPFCALAGKNSGLIYFSPSENSLNLALVFMVIEFLGVSIFCNIIFRQALNRKKNNEKLFTVIGNKKVYFLFFIFTGLIYFLFGRGKGLLNFIYIKVGTGERIGDIETFSSLFIRQLILCSVMLMFVLAVNYASEAFKKYKNKKYYYFALIFALLNISIIVGERRSIQVYTALCSIWILVRLFPEFRKSTILILISSAGSILLFMSVYKMFGAFQFGSYSDSISNVELTPSFFASNLQAYFFGPENIAIAIDFFDKTNPNILQMFFDIFRSVFGLNYLFRGYGEITSVYFNSLIYNTYRSSGQIMSALSYGYGFLGVFFIPLFSCLNIFLTFTCEKILKNLRSLEVIYIVLYVAVRFSTSLFSNTPGLLTSATMFAFTSLFVVVIATLFNKISFGGKDL